MDISKLESDQSYATRNNAYPHYNESTQEITREYMQKRIREYYEQTIEETKTPELYCLLSHAIEAFIEMANYETLEKEFERIEY